MGATPPTPTRRPTLRLVETVAPATVVPVLHILLEATQDTTSLVGAFDVVGLGVGLAVAPLLAATPTVRRALLRVAMVALVAYPKGLAACLGLPVQEVPAKVPSRLAVPTVPVTLRAAPPAPSSRARSSGSNATLATHVDAGSGGTSATATAATTPARARSGAGAPGDDGGGSAGAGTPTGTTRTRSSGATPAGDDDAGSGGGSGASATATPQVVDPTALPVLQVVPSVART